MTFQGVPWAVGNGAEVPVEAARAISYYATDGGEGVAAAGDCAVVPLAVPGAGVRIRKGVVAMLNRFGGDNTAVTQSYLARNPDMEEVTITATGSGGGRTDLIAVVVEDPQYAGQPSPVDSGGTIADGPYVKTRVYAGVPGNTRKLSDVDPDQTGYALARVTLPASTGTVQAAHITDLREIANPRARQVTKVLNNPGAALDATLTSGAYTPFPALASWNSVVVPSWAVKAHLELYVAGVRVKNTADASGDWSGSARLQLGTIVTQASDLKPPPPKAGKTDTFTYMCAGELDVPAAMRGTAVLLEAQAKRDSSATVSVLEGGGTTAIAKVTFFEDVSTDAFTV